MPRSLATLVQKLLRRGARFWYPRNNEATSAMQIPPASEAAIWSRLIGPERNGLSRNAALSLLKLDFSDEDRARSKESIGEEIDNDTVLMRDRRGRVIGFERLNYPTQKQRMLNI